MGNLIFIDTSNAPEFCRNRCANGDCSKHISKGMEHAGACKFSLMRDTDKCEGYRSKRQQAQKAETEAANG